MAAKLPVMVKLSEFQGAFNAEDFVDKLMDLGGGKDATPENLLNIFEACIDHVSDLQKEAEEQLIEANERSKEIEEEQKGNFAKIDVDLSRSFDVFTLLESRIESAGEKVKRIGEQLSASDKQAQRASEAKQLIELYNAFMEDQDSLQNSALISDATNRHEAAKILKKLHDVIKDVVGQDALSRIERLMETIENDLLREFDRAILRKDIPAIKKCAETFVEYNGGESLFSHFVRTRPMFLDPEIISGDQEMIQSATTPQACQQITKKIYKQIMRMLETEHKIITQVFPQPEKATGMLVQRAFAQRIQPILSATFGQIGASGGAAALLPVLCDCYQQSEEFAQQIEKMDTGDVGVHELVMEAFQYHCEEHLSLEIELLKDIFDSHLPINRWLSTKSRLGRTSAGSSDPITWSIDPINECIKANKESIERSKILSPPMKLTYAISEIYLVLQKALEKYICDLLEAGKERISSDVQKDQATLLSIVAFSVTIVIIMQKHIGSVVIPSVAEDSSILAQVMLQQGEWERRIEESVSNCLVEYVNCIMHVIDDLLVSGAKSFTLLYKPKDDNNALEEEPSPAISKVVGFLNRHFVLMQQSFGQNANLDAVLTQLGKLLNDAIINHIKKFVFNPAGGMQLLRDITALKQHVSKYKLFVVDEMFDLLRQMSSLYLVPPDALRSLIEDTAIQRMGHSELIQLVKQRSDYSQAKIGKSLNIE